MPIAEVNGSKVNYLQLQPESKEACDDIVMIHGLATSLAFWYLQYANELSKRYRVTLYDLKGHGRSEMPSTGYSPDCLTNDFEGLMDFLGINKAHIVSHSYGGLIALKYGLRWPQRVHSLVIMDTHIALARRAQADYVWAYGRKIQPILEKYDIDLDTADPFFGYRILTLAAKMVRKGIELPRELSDLIGPITGMLGKKTANQWLKLIVTATVEEELMLDDGLSEEALGQLKMPILPMYGERSQAMWSAECLERAWPDVSFEYLEAGGHFFPFTRSAEVLSRCIAFWRGL